MDESNQNKGLAGPRFSPKPMSNPQEYQQDKELAGPKFTSRAMFTPEDLDAAMKEAAKRGADEALSRQPQPQQPQQPQYQPSPQYAQPQYQQPIQQYQQPSSQPVQQEPTKTKKQESDEEDENLLGVNNKFIKSLQNTVGVFNALKEFATNPLQKAIEQRVGDVAAQVVENAFAPRGPPPKRDIVETILNSQFAYGLGAGLGQRAPELVDTMTKNFGPNKAEEIIDNMIGKYGKGGGGETKQLGPGSGGNPGRGNESGTGKTSETGSGESQKPEQSNIELLLSLDPNNPEHVAAYAESQGGISVDVARKMLMIHQDDIIKKMSPQEATPKNTTQPPRQSEPQQIIPPTNMPISNPANLTIQPGQEYTEFRDTSKGINIDTNKNVENQQNELLKTFSEEIGKVMGDMVTKIESLNNTVSTLQTELDYIKRSNITTTRPIYPVAQPIPPQIISAQPGMIQPGSPMPPTGIPTIRQRAPIPSRPMSPQDIIDASSENLFGEHEQSLTDFKRELEEESNAIKRELEKKEKISPEKGILDTTPEIPEKGILDTTPEIPEKGILDTTPEIPEKVEDKISEKVEDKISEKVEDKISEKVEDIENHADIKQTIEDNKNIDKPNIPTMEKKEEVKFVTPIKSSDVYKRFNPSLKKSEDNKE